MPEQNAKKHHLGHRSRLKKRFMENPALLEDYEVLELIIGYALPRRDTKPLAKDLLERFQSIKGIMDSRRNEIMDLQGFGPGLLTFWQVLKEFMTRYAEAPVRRREVLASPAEVAKMAKARLAGLEKEECWLALVDNQNRLIYWGKLLGGRVSDIPLKPRDILEEAFSRKASGFILTHNHPGGSAKPSTPDKILTDELRKLCLNVELRFLDHLIIADGACYSMTQECLL